MMKAFLNKLIKHDSKLSYFTQDKQIIHQGLAPLTALTNKSVTIQKANLLEVVKLSNWKSKAEILFSELSKENIEFIVFKGFAFTHLLYDGTQIRPYSDIDVIIKKSDYEKAKEVLIRLGYQQYPSRQGDLVSFQNSFYDTGRPQAVIDLHWEINNRIEFHQYYKFPELLANAQYLHIQEIRFLTIGNIDAFILGCFHYQAHRPEDRKHIWLYDLALLWHKMNSSIQNQCIKKAKTTEQSAIVINTLNLVNKTFVDCFIMNFHQEASDNEATEHYLKPRPKKIVDIKARLNNIDGMTSKLKFISEYVFQNKTYVKQRFGINSNLWVYLYYPRMWTEDIFKLLK